MGRPRTGSISKFRDEQGRTRYRVGLTPPPPLVGRLALKGRDAETCIPNDDHSSKIREGLTEKQRLGDVGAGDAAPVLEPLSRSIPPPIPPIGGNSSGARVVALPRATETHEPPSPPRGAQAAKEQKRAERLGSSPGFGGTSGDFGEPCTSPSEDVSRCRTSCAIPTPWSA